MPSTPLICKLTTAVCAINASLTPIAEAFPGTETDIFNLETFQDKMINGYCILRRPGLPDKFYKPALNTDASRGTTLLAALADSQLTETVGSQLFLVWGRFGITTALSATNTTQNTKIVFGGNSAIVYNNPEHAGLDYKFFSGKRNVLNFGATPIVNETVASGSIPNQWKYLQAAANSCEIKNNLPVFDLPSGRKFRSGTIEVPNGQYGIDATWEVSPTCRIEGHGANSTQIWAIGGVFAAAGENFLLNMPKPTLIDINNLFYTSVTNIAFVGNSTLGMVSSSGINILGGQGTYLGFVNVIAMAIRGINATGGTYFGCWVSEIARGPALDVAGGAYIYASSFEHVNAAANIDPATTEVYPTIQVNGGAYVCSFLQGEETGGNPQTFLRINSCYSFVCDSVFFGIALGSTRTHTLVRIPVGNFTFGVNIQNLCWSGNGASLQDGGKLVRDQSISSIAGPGVLYELDGQQGSYNQIVGSAKKTPEYANDAAAAADTTLPSKAQYTITGSTVLHIKP